MDKETGFLVAEEGVNGMAEAMVFLAENPETARSMGLAGRKWVEDHFTMESSITDLWGVLQSSR